MKKTHTVTKYNLKWQVTRILNKKEKCVDDKIRNVIRFYLENKNYHNWERIYNYLEGLDKGYSKILYYEHDRINYALNWLNSNRSDNMNDSDILFSDVDVKILIDLYKDLYKRNQKWLDKNYRNVELNDYLEKLFDFLNSKGIELMKNFNIHPTGINTHKFFF